jgi:hypothetical protein
VNMEKILSAGRFGTARHGLHGAAMACRPSTRPAIAALALTVLTLLAMPALARADCPALPLDRTFLPWLDVAWYEAAPAGSFESGATGWSLAQGAAVGDGNDPFLAGSHSLWLPAGSTATTPPVCVDLAHPTIRFFARGSGAPLLVSVLFRDSLGAAHELPVGSVTAGAGWAPSLPLAVAGNLLSGQVSFRFASASAWQIDDVYVDPYSKG